jgi:hypothetical protein
MGGVKSEDADDLQEETDDDVELEPAALLELIQQAQGNEKWTGRESEDDLVDWGDSDEDEPMQ